jgi:hypothetical protein
VTEPVWRDLTHQQVWEQVHAGPGPYVSDGAATAWSNAQAALRQIDSDLGAAITKAAGWTGPAADATRRGLTPLGGWAVDATGSAGRAAASLTDHQVQVAWVRANLPEPGPAPALGPPIPLSDAGVDPAVLQNWTASVGRNTALADQAFHVMDTYAANTALIQQQVPTWTPPPAVTMSVADRPPPSGALGAGVATFPTTVAPAAALAIAGAAAGGAVGPNAGPRPAVAAGSTADRPAGAATSQGEIDRLPSAAVPATTPAASIPAQPASGEHGSASADGSTSFAPGAVVSGTLPDGPGVLRGGLDGSALPADGTAGGPTGLAARTGTGGPGSTGNADGVLRGLPDSRATGVLRGAPEPDGRSSRGGGLLGGQPGDPAAPGRSGSWADPVAALRGGAASSSGGRPVSAGSPGYMPMGATGLGNRGDTHRRPDYLVGTYSFFGDDRVLTGPLITPEEPLPLPT